MKNIQIAIFFICFSNFLFSQNSEKIKIYAKKSEIDTLKAKILTFEPHTQLKSTKQRKYIGQILKTNLNLKNSGSWKELKDGKLWLLKIKVLGAKALSLYYDNFKIVNSNKLIIYNSNQNQILGSFDENSNSDGSVFASGIISGDEIILEYFVPKSSSNKGAISINEINAIFQADSKNSYNKSGFGTSDSCQINVNCAEVQGWENEKNSTVRWLSRNNDGSWWCSGTLINNGKQDFKPYILSSEHNVLDNNYEQPDNSYYQQFIFYFNFESKGCETPQSIDSIPIHSLTGCKLIAHSNANGEIKGSDFILLELQDEIPESYLPYYAGWTREDIVYDSAFCIHHPNGDIKKISKANSLQSASKYGLLNNYWEANWQAIGLKTGTTEIGSSGSALFNPANLIIGTLSTGNSNCSSPLNYDYYGKFSYHWDSNGSRADEQLKPWLDPDNLGITSLKGSFRNSNSIDYITEKELGVKLFPNPTSDLLNISTDLNPSKEINIKILSITGSTIFNETFSANESIIIKVANFQKGIYIIKITSDLKTASKQFIKL